MPAAAALTEAEYTYHEVASKFAAFADDNRRIAACKAFLHEHVRGHESRAMRISAHMGWLAVNFPAEAEAWRRSFPWSDELQRITSSVAATHNVLRGKISSVSARWPAWDWTIPGGKTPDFWGERLLKGMVTLSIRTSDWEAVVEKLRVAVRGRMVGPRGPGMSSVPKVEPCDANAVLALYPLPPHPPQRRHARRQDRRPKRAALDAHASLRAAAVAAAAADQQSSRESSPEQGRHYVAEGQDRDEASELALSLEPASPGHDMLGTTTTTTATTNSPAPPASPPPPPPPTRAPRGPTTFAAMAAKWRTRLQEQEERDREAVAEAGETGVDDEPAAQRLRETQAARTAILASLEHLPAHWA